MSEPRSDEPGRVGPKTLAISVYLPALLLAIGEGAIAPIIALMALDLGATAAVAGVMVALRSVGTMLFDIPAGVLVGRFGERRLVVAASSALCVAAVVLAFGPPLPLYGTLLIVLGTSTSVWGVARVTFLTEAVAPLRRGQALSLMGGTDRIGILMGAFLSSVVIGWVGLSGPFMVQAGTVAVAALLLMTGHTLPRPASGTVPVRPSIRSIVGEHKRNFRTAGVVVGIMSLVRVARQAIVPLWGDQIGLTAEEIATIFAISTTIEIISFYPVGLLMDRKGRKWVGLPFLTVLSLGLLLVPLTDTFGMLLRVSLLMSLGNGFGAGIVMTLGSDLSPKEGRSQVLGVWRLIGDVGAAGGPLLVAALTALATIGVASVGVGLIGFIGAAVLAFVVPETRPGSRERDP